MMGKFSKAFWNGKKVFVTGHTGFKGAWLCKILEAAGADVTGYALAPPSGPNLFGICKPAPPSFNSVYGDVRDFEKLLSVYSARSPEIVIHMAAQPLVIESYDKPRYTYETNVMGTVNLLECVRMNGGARSVLNVTTDKVYLNRERAEGYKEDETLNGYDPYSNSKSCSELVTSSYRNSFFNSAGIPVSTARSGNVIGGGDFADNRLIPDCAGALSKNGAVKIRNPKSVRPYQHVLDTLFAYLLILKAQYENPSLADAYNIGPEERDCLTNAELAGLFCESWGEGASWEDASGGQGGHHEAGLLKLDSGKIKTTLGWQPVWNIKKSVEETALWYKEYYNAYQPTEVMERQIEAFISN